MDGPEGYRPPKNSRDVEALADRLEALGGPPDAVAFLRLKAELLRGYENRDYTAMRASPSRVEAVRAGLGPGSRFADDLATLAKLARINALLADGDVAALFREFAAIRASTTALPVDDPTRRRVDAMANEVDALQAGYKHVTGSAEAPRLRPIDLDKLRWHALYDDVPPDVRAGMFARLGVAVGAMGTKVPGMTGVAISDLRRAVDVAPPDDIHLPLYLTYLGNVLLQRAVLIDGSTGPARWVESGFRRHDRRARHDETEGIDTLRRAVEVAGGPGAMHWALSHVALSRGYRQVGRPDDARRAGLDGLRGHAWRVLLQSHTEAATSAVRHAIDDALDVAGWHVEDGDPDGAISALDAGRGLLLHSATEIRNVPDRLRARGATELADRWPTGPLDEVPVELRRAALSELTEPGGLLDPPTVAEIRDALTAMGAETLVYLVPTGVAVMVGRGAPAAVLRLPRLTDPPFAPRRTVMTSRDLGPSAFAPQAPDELGELLEWAWQVAIGPLLDVVSAGRIVLIPVGELTRVPWHAARHHGRYAIETATFSYAASARLLCRTTGVTLDGPVLIVGDPDCGDPRLDLPGARAEALAVCDVHPGARYLGRLADGSDSPDGAGTPAEVLAWQRGILHLACHGTVRVGTGPHDTSYLRLAGGRLAAEDLVAGRAKTAPGLVVLAACSSSVSGRGWDEAFSLGTAFLAGGAGAVVATRWSVPDEATSHLMVRFHRHLATKSPAEALRHAQLDALADGPAAWAGFVHYGA